MAQQQIILFDGVCSFCNNAVQFIIKRDPKRLFVFCSLQSQKGQEILELHKIPKTINSIVLIQDQMISIESDAVIRIVKQLTAPWKVFYIFRFIPRSCRNWLYGLIAKNRFRWFHQEQTCSIPSSLDQTRFLE